MISFEWIWAFLFLPLPWLIRRRLPPAEKTTGPALRIPFFEAVMALETKQAHTRKTPTRLRLWLMVAIWLLLVTATARPQWLGEALTLPLTGRDLMLAIDISGSMEIPDFDFNGQQATRLQVVKHVAGDFIERRIGDRIGLILFGTRAYLQTPLTFDRDTVKDMLHDATIGLAGKETAIGDAIGLAIKRLLESGNQQQVLILLTDGANTTGEVKPIQAAQLAARAGMKIYTIGVGAEQMRVNVPTMLGSQVVNPSKDLDERTLRLIAEQTGGEYFRARDRKELERIYEQLDELEPREQDEELFRPVQQLYYWPLGGALLLSTLLALSLLLPPRPWRWLTGPTAATKEN